jgi:hypothetical protein
MKGLYVLLAASCMASLVACGGGSKPESAPPANAPAASGSAADTGVPECDDYIKKYEACIDSKVPDAAKAQVRSALDQSKAMWKQTAANPQAKAALASGCKTALDTAKTAMSAYGCSW